MPRYTAESYQPLAVQGKEIVVPPHVHLLVNSATLHTLPSYWGNDSSVWRPNRWLNEKEELLQPPPGMFNPWTVGPRVCPGKKFAQVEFVAVITRLLKNGKVKPKLVAGEKKEDAIVRIMEVVQDSDLNVTLNMKRPEKAPLVWERAARAEADLVSLLVVSVYNAYFFFSTPYRFYGGLHGRVGRLENLAMSRNHSLRIQYSLSTGTVMSQS
jgi:hypothetical protein